MMQQKASLYKRSRFCVVPPGDSYITPRIFSFTAAACVPVFTFNRSFLPYQTDVDWPRVSLSINGSKLLSYHSACARTRANATCRKTNPLEELLGALTPASLRTMQEALLVARERLAYREGSAPSAVHSLAAEIQRMHAVDKGRLGCK